MEKFIQGFMALIKSEVSQYELTENDLGIIASLSKDNLYRVSKSHDLAHIVGAALERNGFLAEGEELTAKFDKQRLIAVYRYRQIEDMYTRICSVFENEGIEYLPLKGSVIRPLYREGWQRTSCDIDILIRDTEIDRAVKVLSHEIGFSNEPFRNYHDVSLIMQGGIHLELHFCIKESFEKMDRVLVKVWDYARRDENSFKNNLTPEFFLFYIIAHCAWHFMTGGCGVRPLIDLWLIRENMSYNQEIFNSLLKKAGLIQFAEAILGLSDVWFLNGEREVITNNMEIYILRSGVYGLVKNKLAVQTQQHRGIAYFLRKIVIPIDKMAIIYPRVERYPILYPFYYVKRILRRVLINNRSNKIKEAKRVHGVSENRMDEISSMLEALGLKNV